jgi:hypothetical protein
MMERKVWLRSNGCNVGEMVSNRERNGTEYKRKGINNDIDKIITRERTVTYAL